MRCVLKIKSYFTIAFGIFFLFNSHLDAQQFILSKDGSFAVKGCEVLIFNNWYDGDFSDAKIAGIEMIHHGVRTVTNGDVRLHSTPAQWDAIPQLQERIVSTDRNEVIVKLRYPQFNFDYSIRAKAESKYLSITVELDKPIPSALVGRAGLNLEFLPATYFEKGFLFDSTPGVFPQYPTGPMALGEKDTIEVKPLAHGKNFVAAPDDPQHRINIASQNGELYLYDGRNVAQNGWFVLRQLLPANKKGVVVEWHLSAAVIPNWKREPVVLFSQIGYYPTQYKEALIELDAEDTITTEPLKIYQVNPDGMTDCVYSSVPKQWGKYLRYNYLSADFSNVSQEGLYYFEYRGKRTNVFRISNNVYDDIAHATVDVYFPVQMDHMYVREAYRVWHGAAHLDDALQAPANHVHFDLYAQGPTLDSPFQPFQHIPGLNVGGWFDAGDFDIRTQTHYSVVQTLAHVWEDFKPMRDETYINQKNRYVEIHRPDGIPDVVQQVEHGTIALVAQFRVFGHAIPGIIDGSLHSYTHLGDAASQTDNKQYSPQLKPFETVCDSSGNFDDRWAFTTKTSALNYGSIAALAAASRVLKGYNDSLANECLSIAKSVWDEEHSHPPIIFNYGNTTGGFLPIEEINATTELLCSTKDDRYARRVKEIIMSNDTLFSIFIPYVVRAYSFLDAETQKIFSDRVKGFYGNNFTKFFRNPFRVPITRRGWAGNGAVLNYGITNYSLYKVFPDLIDKENVVRALQYVTGLHPGSNISFVSAVGTVSKKIAYGNNRADFTFIAGGVVPGVLILNPDFPENKEDWPFFWGENEYVIGAAANYVYLSYAAKSLMDSQLDSRK